MAKACLDVNSSSEANYYLGSLYLERAAYSDAVKFLKKAVLKDGQSFEARHDLGAALALLGKTSEALDALLSAAQLNSHSSELHFNLGRLYEELCKSTEAIEHYDKALAINDQYLEAYLNKGILFEELRDFESAKACYMQAIKINPLHRDVWLNYSKLLTEQNQNIVALEAIDKAIAIDRQYANAHSNKAFILNKLERPHDALSAAEEALRLNPLFAEAWVNRGISLRVLKSSDEAIASYQKALSIKPDYAEAWSNQGAVLAELKRFDEAIASYQKALSIKPDYAEAWSNQGAVLAELKRFDEAIASYQKSLSIKPDYAEAWSNQGAVLAELKRFDEAIASYQKALSIKPDYDFLEGMLAHLNILACDWKCYQERVNSLLKKVKNGKKVVSPFTLLAISDDESAHLEAAKIWANKKIQLLSYLPSKQKTTQRKKIRIGYFSADFRNHPVAHLAAGLFEAHDKERFETYAFSFGPSGEDAMRLRLKNAFDDFIDVRGKTDQEIVDLARDLEIDIALDLTGHTEHNRIEVFAKRVAPIQINYLGYPGTMGASCYDYIIADSTLIPDSQQKYYSEKVIYMANTYQPNDRARPISSREFSRAELGLPEAGFVFGCFNNNFKITPSIFAIWMQLLTKINGSVLWLFEDNPLAVENLRKHASEHGISPDRLVFAQRMELSEHLARLRFMNLFLDTLPYNAHTTASDALWCGVPVLTCLGKSFAGRVAASLLDSIGVPELITHSLEEYESRALELAADKKLLDSIKDKLILSRLKCPLFDTKAYTLELESVYESLQQLT
ncbi:tetratricopeptide repeat protein [Polynucleobacter campilacus]|uniref:tetratricopeptide repeat protein n=1 Tax=Polynucleobacter campilacus TaxID=1743163 RepID=UPI001F0A7699|nr:tetratricopeptide repeat protein [Polynucleobacter campilacus]